jgi:hypothetical protein
MPPLTDVQAGSSSTPDDDGLYNLPNLEIGGAGLKSVKFTDNVPSNFAVIKASSGIPIIGILGYNALRMLAVGIDFKAQKAFFWGTKQGDIGKASFFGSTANLDRVPILSQDLWPRIPIKFNDRSYYAVLDTGSPIPLIPESTQTWVGNDFSAGKGFPAYMTFATVPSQHLLVREMTVGTNRLDCVPLMETKASGLPLIAGLSVFAAFHKVFFDFDGGYVNFPTSDPKLVGVNGLECLAGRPEYGEPGSQTSADIKTIVDTSDPDWRNRMKVVQKVFAPQLPSNLNIPMNVPPPPALKLAWSPQNVYFSPFDKGPGVYNVRPKAAVPDKWPMGLVVAKQTGRSPVPFRGCWRRPGANSSPGQGLSPKHRIRRCTCLRRSPRDSHGHRHEGPHCHLQAKSLPTHRLQARQTRHGRLG